MKKLWLALLFCVSLPALADGGCSPELRAPAGPYKGTCMDVSVDRPVRRVDSRIVEDFARKLRDPSIADESRNVVLENYLYRGRFYRAVIPYAQIQRVVYEEVMIAPKDFDLHGLKVHNVLDAWHSQLRFQLAANVSVRIIDESGAFPRIVTLPSSNSQSDFVYALWALRPEGHQEKFNPFHGADGEYGIAYSIQAFPDAVDWTVADGMQVRQRELDLDPEEARGLFLGALFHAEDRGTRDVYNTLSNSCSDAAFDVLMPAFHEKNPAAYPATNQGLLLRQAESLDPEHKLLDFHMVRALLPDVSAELAAHPIDFSYLKGTVVPE